MGARSGRGNTFLGRSDRSAGGGNGSSNSGGGGSWAMPRSTTARGTPLEQVSPMLRPRQSGFSHSVTPSPTFPGQEVRGLISEGGFQRSELLADIFILVCVVMRWKDAMAIHVWFPGRNSAR